MALNACERNTSTTFVYNIDSLVSHQSLLLATVKASADKHAAVDLETEHHVITPKDSLAWSNELAVFRTLNAINKSVSGGAYVIDTIVDRSSNLTIKTFTAVEDLPVRHLKVFYQGSPENPRRIEAMYDERNALYASTRMLTMEFQKIRNEHILTAYTVKGGQKMILSDSVTYQIKSNIVID